jgi:photosystem I P700 chlorophyll a apoprotein A1
MEDLKNYWVSEDATVEIDYNLIYKAKFYKGLEEASYAPNPFGNNDVSITEAGVPTSFDLWGRPGHFYKRLAKGPQTTTWIWNLHADAHDFDLQVKTLEDLARRVFSAHFGHLSIIFLWLSGMYFHGSRFSNYSAWLENPTEVIPSSHVVWPVVGQEILNAPLGGGFSGIRVTSGWFQLWRSAGIMNESELYWTAIGGLVMSALMLVAGWFHFHVASPKLRWFGRVDSMLRHHIGGVLAAGSLAWSGHQVHVSLPINKLLDSGVDPKDIPLPHEFLLDRDMMAELYPVFKSGLLPLFLLDWGQYADLLTFRGGLNPVTGGLWLTDVAHHHLAVAITLALGAAIYADPSIYPVNEYRVEILQDHGPLRSPIKSILDKARIPVLGGTGDSGYITHEGVYEILLSSLHAQLALNLSMLGSLSIIVSHHMYAMPPYPFIAVDYPTQLSLFTHHMWIGGFCIVGGGAHASIFMVRDYNPLICNAPLLEVVLGQRDTIISHLNWVCIFLGFHSFGLYCHNDTMRALGRPGDVFADGSSLHLLPLGSSWVGSMHVAPSLYSTAPGTIAAASYVFGGEAFLVRGKVAMAPIELGTADFLVHHIHAFNIHVTALILLKGVLFARSSRLIPDKALLGFRFPCDGPGRGGTCQVSGWDHVFLALFWMYNTISITIFYFDWRLSTSVWGTLGEGGIDHLLGGNFGLSAIAVNGWFRDYLWATSISVVSSYGTPASAYGLIFLGAHFIWAFSLMFLFSGRGYWQELIESIVWAHNKLKVSPSIQPRALSITQGRAVGVAHYLLGGIGTTWAFFLCR